MADAAEVSMVLAEAFCSDPLFVWEFPDDTARPRILRAMFAHVAEYVYLPAGTSAFCENGAALWQPPGVQLDKQVEPGQAGAFVKAVEGQIERLMSLVAVLDEAHPVEPHWYLPVIGVRPTAQGKGIGSRLLEFTLNQIDEQGDAAYLEATSLRNAALYARHGFEVVGELKVADGPPLFPMWRKPA
ncbi:MAG TPA: GNAT family N-acetyltransferase [Acidimicrobiales bacterium]|nr:GNAT family N-acetyltransferase [Acidimicrobiales bacterium]